MCQEQAQRPQFFSAYQQNVGKIQSGESCCLHENERALGALSHVLSRAGMG